MIKFGFSNAFRRKATLIIATVGTGLGVGLMTTLLSLSEGMDKRLTDTTNQVAGDIDVASADSPFGGIGANILGGGTPLPLSYEEVIDEVAHTRFVTASITASIPKEAFGTQGPLGSTLNGVDPVENAEMDGAANHIVEGRMFAAENEVILGKEGKQRAEWADQEVYIGMEIEVPIARKLNGNGTLETGLPLGEADQAIAEGEGVVPPAEGDPIPPEGEQTSPPPPTPVPIIPAEPETVTLTLVGIFDSGNPFDDSLFYSDLATARKIAQLADDEVTSFLVRVDDTEFVEEVAEQIEIKFEAEPVPVETGVSKDILGDLNETLDIFDTFLLVIALVASVAGGMSILIIMLMNVTERMKEFGILKAAGWSNWNIVLSVLVEAITVSFLGAGVGFGVGYGVVYALNYYLDDELGIFTWELIFGVILFGIIMGVIGGLYPAMRAARVAPMKTLRGD